MDANDLEKANKLDFRVWRFICTRMLVTFQAFAREFVFQVNDCVPLTKRLDYFKFKGLPTAFAAMYVFK